MQHEDRTLKAVLGVLLLNNRLKYYRRYIRYAQENGYRVLSLEAFYRLSPDERRTGKHFILRHDIDWVNAATKRMFRIEQECGVTSTSYFRFLTFDKKLMNEMKEAGFDIGLHFETIAEYIERNQITDRSEIDLEKMRELLKRDIRRFEREAGFKTCSCCSHGHPLNSKFQISNNALTEGQDLSRFGLLFEAYEADLYDHYIDCHIIDGGILNNYGFRYPDNPYEAVDKEYQNIIFLSHPHNWNLKPVTRLLLLRGLIRGKATWESSQEFKRVAM